MNDTSTQMSTIQVNDPLWREHHLKLGYKELQFSFIFPTNLNHSVTYSMTNFDHTVFDYFITKFRPHDMHMIHPRVNFNRIFLK